MEMAASAIEEMVLDVSGNSFRNLPNSISKRKNLKNLRLLDLGNLGLKHLRDLEPLLPPEVEENDMPSKCYSFRNLPNSISKMMNLKNLKALVLRNLWNLGNSEYLLFRRELKNLQYLRLGLRYLPLPPEVEKNNMSSKSCSQLEPLLPPEVEENDMPPDLCGESEALLPLEVEKNDMPSESWKINLGKFPPLTETRDAEHGFFGRLRNLLRKGREIDDYYKKQISQLEGSNEVKIMIETGCAPGNPAEDEMKPRERMASRVTNIANIVLFALKVFASIESKSLSIIASILDPFFDLLWVFILWLTSHAMQNPNPHKYPIGKKRMQPVGMIVFGSFGLQLLFLATKQFITKSEPEKDPQKQKWMIGVMTFVTMVEFMLAFYCRRFENKIVRAYAEHHSSNVKTNLISLAATVLAIRYYWWIDPTGAIIILLYTMNSWKKMFFKNLFALIGRTAPPEILEKLTHVILKHHEDIEQSSKVRAYTSVPDQYFVEVDIVLPQDMVLSETRDIVGTLRVKLEQLPEIARAFVQIDSE